MYLLAAAEEVKGTEEKQNDCVDLENGTDEKQYTQGKQSECADKQEGLEMNGTKKEK